MLKLLPRINNFLRLFDRRKWINSISNSGLPIAFATYSVCKSRLYILLYLQEKERIDFNPNFQVVLRQKFKSKHGIDL